MLKFDFNTFMNINGENDYIDKIKEIKTKLEKKESMLDWLDINTTITKHELEKVISVSSYIRKNADVFLVIGIGGSYLGSKAIIDMFKPYFKKDKVEIIFAGFSLSSSYLKELIEYIKDKQVIVNVISKSGNTLETNITFNAIYDLMKKKYSKTELHKRIIITTDKKKGKLRELVQKEKFISFKVPDNIGGRYSVFSSVGILPVAVANINITRLLAGVKRGKKDIEKCFIYAIIRDILYKKGKKIESFTVYEPKLYYFTEWIKQLFSETQGKNNLGLFPVSVVNSRDLHSLGQYYQQGEPIIFETVINIVNNKDIKVSNKSLNKINNLATIKVAEAHRNHTPSNIICMDYLNEENIGELMYFFMVSAAIGGYLLGVDPFNQPGVEEYKKLLIEGIKKI